RFSYSMDGKKFISLGQSFTAREGKWIGAKMGLFCSRPVSNNDGGRVVVDSFIVDQSLSIMKTKSFFALLILLSCFYWQVAAQTVIINDVPRDTSYTVHSSYIKEVKRFPFIRIASAEIPSGIKAMEAIPYKSIGERILTLSVYRPDNDEI